MREIKFRAWNTVHNKMSNTFTLTDCISQRQVFVNEESFEFEQYTGLKDKNGREIFEGDIVRILYTDWMSKGADDPRTLDEYLRDIAHVMVVEWSFNGFYVAKQPGAYHETMEYGTHGYIEIIGNIHENKEEL